MTRDALIAAAQAACRQSHSPYSCIRVGAAIRSRGGAVHTGANVENAAYPLGNCAEVSAIAAGIQQEGGDFRIVEIAVWALDRNGQILAASPCGGCRQRIEELAADPATLVHFPWHAGEIRTVSIGELLPFAFLHPDPSRAP